MCKYIFILPVYNSTFVNDIATLLRLGNMRRSDVSSYTRIRYIETLFIFLLCCENPCFFMGMITQYR